jgi:hypothetical protein
LAQEKANPYDFLPAEVLYQSRNEGYVLEISNLSNQWEVIAIGVDVTGGRYSEMITELGEEGDDDQPKNPLSNVDYFLQADQRIIETNTELVAENEQVYAERFIQFEVDETKNEIKKEEERIAGAEKKKDHYYQIIAELEDELTYQTDDELEQSELEILRLKEYIRSLDDDIHDYKINIELLEQKVENLKEKYKNFFKKIVFLIYT